MFPRVTWARLAVLTVGALAVGCEKQPAAELLQPPASEQKSTLAPLWPVPDFSLTERSGKPITLADLKGKVWVADFFYTTCPGPCPMLSSRLTELQKELGAEDRVRLVSISTDPEKDTPDVLQLYAKKFEATERWFFLTGSKTQIYDLGEKGFKLPIVEDRSEKEPITHSTRLALVDQTGVVRGFYEGVGEDGTKRLIEDIHRLLEGQP